MEYIEQGYEYVFGTVKTPKEMLRECKRRIERSCRDLVKEREKLINEEKKSIREMKREAERNQMNAVKTMAKGIARGRQYQDKYLELKVQLEAVSSKVQAMQSTQEMMSAMSACAKSMAKMSKRFNLPAVQKMLVDFQMQNDKMDQVTEAVDDVIDNGLEATDSSTQEETIIAQVLDSAGIKLRDTSVTRSSNSEMEVSDRLAQLKLQQQTQ